jgi:hypothetical protein
LGQSQDVDCDHEIRYGVVIGRGQGRVDAQFVPRGAHRRLGVRNLEALDGTPIIDVKPILSEDISQR